MSARLLLTLFVAPLLLAGCADEDETPEVPKEWKAYETSSSSSLDPNMVPFDLSESSSSSDESENEE